MIDVPTVLRRALAGAVLLIALPFAALAEPSARTNAMLVFDESLDRPLLFGGVTPPFVRGDSRVARARLDETWVWTGRRWIQRFFDVQPPARSSAAMVWDANRDRVLLFGGAGQDDVALADTWEFRDDAWHRLEPPASPSARRLAGHVFDPLRDRFIIYGGAVGPTTTLQDTWEFDGTTWTQVGTTGPDVRNPILVYDETRDEVLMVAVLDDGTSAMYRYDAPTWTEIEPEDLPPCVNLANMVWQEHNGKVLLAGGLCAQGNAPGETWEWDGTNWTEVEAKGSIGFVFGHAMTYDEARGETILFGGTELNFERNETYRYRDGVWKFAADTFSPGPRSLFVFATDPETGAIWLFGGLNGPLELWRYQAGNWERVVAPNAPSACAYPVGTWDTDRDRLVVVCEDSSVYEFDGTEWTAFAVGDPSPDDRRFSGIAYDPNLEKTVLYGGWDGANYVRETWTWNGTRWTEVEADTQDTPAFRALPIMFYDPDLGKIVVYGGIGRLERTGTLVRFGDTFTFDGSRWSELTSASSPPPRYGALVAFNPADGRTHMFGGKNETEEFIAEHWVFENGKWSRVEDTNGPSPRQNGGLAWDPFSGRLTLYGGYAGYYLSDIWVLEEGGWEPVDQGNRRRPRVEIPFGEPVEPQSLSRPVGRP
ncbi:MAG: Kelch repeat-containing protein [Thermoanaerobaculia bacterium]